MAAIGTYGEARLRAWLDARITRPGEAAYRTKAIPLRKTAARCCTKNDSG